MKTVRSEYLERNRTLKELYEREPSGMKEARLEAAERFERLPWPSTSDEEWRRSDISMLGIEEYLAGPRNGGSESEAPAIKWDPLPGSWSGAIGFHGGKLVHAELSPELAAKGVIFSSHTGDLSSRYNGALSKTEALFAHAVGRIDNRVEALHYSVWDHGVVLYVPPFVEVKEPFFIDFYETGKKVHTAPHLLVYLDTGARAVVIQRIRSRDREEILCNAALDAKVEESAGLDLVTLQTLGSKAAYFSHGTVVVGRSGVFHGLEAVFGASFTKTRLEVELDGEGSDTFLRGVYFADKDRHMDLRTVQRHLAPNAGSRSFYKGAVKDESRTVYQGLIEVAPNAVRTDAYLSNKNLVLSDGARADSIPSLQIKTNDVKCSHGSTTGKIDPEQRFYLQSRGLSRTEADRLLVAGYFEEVYRTAPEQVHEPIRKLIEKRLGRG
jgi:Fe-S cluster assembly protein SufD